MRLTAFLGGHKTDGEANRHALSRCFLAPAPSRRAPGHIESHAGARRNVV